MRELALSVELRSERQQLVKAVRDIEDGRLRLDRQQAALADLRAGGRNTTEVERLVELTSKTLTEWQRHCSLIEQRIRYLEGKMPG